MKGPFGRIRHNTNRHWRCPRCGREAASPGTTVFLQCACPAVEGDDAPAEPALPAEPVWMKLLAPPLPDIRRGPLPTEDDATTSNDTQPSAAASETVTEVVTAPAAADTAPAPETPPAPEAAPAGESPSAPPPDDADGTKA